jgi:hypothetical protein
LNAVDYVYIPQLLRGGIISQEQAEAFHAYDKYLDTLEPEEDYEVCLKELESGDWFNELRKKALELLELLGEDHKKPTLDDTTHIQGV